MAKEDIHYCPCCASDNTRHTETNHTDSKLVETFKCNFCQSTFENIYNMSSQVIVVNNSDAMYILKAKEVLIDELKVLGDNINTSRGFADGRIHMLIDCLINDLNEWDSKDLAETYYASSFYATYEKTTDADLEK